ncbi:hypothetical protein [Actinomadura decatromicini]|uniref:Uncharacterized protein n=1 Tax=Actinomadura decatromicini TaxID=2604572 RepID=A0A5D3FAP0_9ACTN|nr:hypothetical protein [Actinomadura decatromicini]TYK45142.1 hypothetical protein FXF68_31165 [Actinomadura decatromicini]
MSVLTQTGAFRAWWSLVIVLVVAVFIAGSSVFYTNREQRQSDQRWCALLASLDQPQAPATTERGRVIQAQIHELRVDLGCV